MENKNLKQTSHHWGYKNHFFDIDRDKQTVELKGHLYPFCGYEMPYFFDLIEKKLGYKCNLEALNEIKIRAELMPPKINEDFLKSLKALCPKSKIDFSNAARLNFSHGQGVTEIYEFLYGKLPKIIDIAFFPSSEEDLQSIIELAGKFSVCLVPYGGGTNVTRALKIPEIESRTVICVVMKNLNKVLWLDKKNNRACVEAGITGIELERQLNLQGYVCGHEPDSHEFSTLGGWIATYASGMKRNRYGNIEDIVESMTLLTPQGIIEDKVSFPRKSLGMNIQKYLFGNEGNLGIVTKAIIKIHPKPLCTQYDSVVFPSLENGLKFINTAYQDNYLAASMRLVDNHQISMGEGFSPKSGNLLRIKTKCLKFFLAKFKKIDFNKISLVVCKFEGNLDEINFQKNMLFKSAKKFGGVKAGSKNGKKAYDMTFVISYIRDLLFKLQIIGDTLETTIPWDKAIALFDNLYQAAEDLPKALNLKYKILLSGRITQFYHSGVCAYFTFAVVCKDLKNPTEHFEMVKAYLQDVILKSGGSLSHHHGIGKARTYLLPTFSSPLKTSLIKTFKNNVDPNNIFGIANNFLNEKKPREDHESI